MKTKIAVLTEPGKFEIQETSLAYGEHEILVKIEACGLCNWELNHWKGIITGHPHYLGHEVAGTVVAVGSKVKNFQVGDSVTTLKDTHGFAEYEVVQENLCFKINKEADTKFALGEPLKCIVTVLKATAPKLGDCGVIVGSGPMGLWCTQALSGRFLSKLIVVDVNDDRLALAKKSGATHVINSQKEDAVAAINQLTGGRMADFVIEGTGIPALLNTCAKYLKVCLGKLVVMSSHETICKEFDFREFINRGAQIIAASPKCSIDQLEDMRLAVGLINSGTFRCADLVTHRFSLDDITKAFQTLENKPADYIKGVVIP